MKIKAPVPRRTYQIEFSNQANFECEIDLPGFISLNAIISISFQLLQRSNLVGLNKEEREREGNQAPEKPYQVES